MGTCIAYGAARGNTASELREEAPSPDYGTLFDPAAELVNAEEWLLRLDYASLAEGRTGPSEARLHQVGALLLALLPGVTDVSVAPKTGARFLAEYGWVPLRGLSLGYQTMIAWTVDLAWRMVRRYPDAADPLAEPAVVLVDEIDLHLHPRWQRELIDFLSARFPRTQFIVTAHSPLIVQAATEANVVVLRREGDHVVIENNPERVKAWRVDQLLTSDLFGLEGSRAPAVEKLLAERAELMSKRRLSGADRKRIAAIEAELGPVPTAERSADEEAMQVIRAAAAALQGGARG